MSNTRPEWTVADLAILAVFGDDVTVRAAVQDAIASASRTVSAVESFRRFRILPGGFSEEADELTPTLKLDRAVIAAHFRTEIDALCGDHRPDLDHVLRHE